MIKRKHLTWLIAAFFAGIVAIVFQQIHTSMTEQGIASGGPYDNGAAYPRAVAIAIAVLFILQMITDYIMRTGNRAGEVIADPTELRRPVLLLVIFGVYLGLLDTLGYHLTTAPMILLVTLLCGARSLWKLVAVALFAAFSLAYVFENFLNIVLPGGIFHLNIAW